MPFIYAIIQPWPRFPFVHSAGAALRALRMRTPRAYSQL